MAKLTRKLSPEIIRIKIDTVVRYLLFMVFVILFFCCSALAESNKIAFIIATEKEERYAKDKKYFFDEAKKLGLDVFFASSDGDQNKQNELVANAIEEGAKVLIIQPVDSFSAKRSVEIAKSQKIPVIAYDRIIYNADVDYYVTHDSVLVGVIQARECINFVKKDRKNVLIVAGGKNHSVAKQITAGNLMVLERYPNVKIIGVFYHENWDEKESYVTLRDVLEKTRDIDCILANNSSLARGAIKAIGEKGLEPGEFFIAGADADAQNIKLILQGKQKIEILKDIESLARTAVRVANEIIGGKVPNFHDKLNNGKVDVKVINVPVELIKRDNIEALIKRGFHRRGDIYD